MQKLIDIKRRMEAVEGIRTIARSLSTVSSAKLSRTRGRAAGARVYVGHMRDMLERQLAYASAVGVELGDVSTLLAPHASRTRVLFIHLSGDRGMCGNYNAMVNRATAADLERLRGEGREVQLLLLGKHGEKYLARRFDVPVRSAEAWPRAGVTDELVDQVCAMATEAFLGGEVDEVWCRYTRYLSAVQRHPVLVRLLPIEVRQPSLALEEEGALPDEAALHALTVRPVAPLTRWWHEPSMNDVLDALLGLFARAQFEDVLLESYASEQAARMVTMEEASERAERTMLELRTRYNRLRREAITSDLLGVLFASRMRGETVVGGQPHRGGRSS